MQEHQPTSGAGEATTKPPRIRPPMFTMKLDNPSHCDICGKHRSVGRHTSCSIERQRRTAKSNAAPEVRPAR